MIVLVRHTRVAVPQGTIYGHSDVQLAASFVEEAEAVVERLIRLLNEHGKGVDDGRISVNIHSSPLSRCSRLASHIRQRLGSSSELALEIQGPISFDDRLREMNFGDWENQTWLGVRDAGGETWGDNWETQATPNGESFPQLFERTCAFLEALIAATEARTGASVEIVVTHSGVIRCLHAHVNGLARREAFSLSPEFGSVHLLKPPHRAN